jgi:hypothetical protein
MERLATLLAETCDLRQGPIHPQRVSPYRAYQPLHHRGGHGTSGHR